jgi:hypothetical protein
MGGQEEQNMAEAIGAIERTVEVEYCGQCPTERLVDVMRRPRSSGLSVFVTFRTYINSQTGTIYA